MSRGPVIAIDGPAGSGKSTVGRALALRLGFAAVDSGLFYRAAALAVLRAGGDPDDVEDAVTAARGLELSIAPGGTPDQPMRVLDADVDITADVRSPEVERAVSRVARIPRVREALLGAQQRAIGRGGVVAMGRDIGTVVWPQAELKIFLDATLETRVERRWRDQSPGAAHVPRDEIRDFVRTRDRIDSTRATAPLRAADDALVLATDGLPVKVVVDEIEHALRERRLLEAC